MTAWVPVEQHAWQESRARTEARYRAIAEDIEAVALDPDEPPIPLPFVPEEAAAAGKPTSAVDFGPIAPANACQATSTSAATTTSSAITIHVSGARTTLRMAAKIGGPLEDRNPAC